MKTNRNVMIDADRCLMCFRPVCDMACSADVRPASVIQALHLDNESGARLRLADKTACVDCSDPKCEKACARGRIDHAIQIRDICRAVIEQEKPQVGGPTDLSVDFCGVRCENPFLLASSPVASSYEMCCRAFDQGWAGVAYKTISFYQTREVSPRFDSLPSKSAASFQGFKNLEQLSPYTAEENFDVLRRLKEKYPEKVIIASVMGQTVEEWTTLARMAEEAGADMVECNFSCPQMAKQGLGSDIGQSPELISLYTQATRKGCSLPVIAKMTPNAGNMEPLAMAAVTSGANSVAAINTIKSITRIRLENDSSFPDIEGKSAVGGYSGRAVKPIALRFIRDMAAFPPLAGVSLCGIGGITTWRDALDFLLLGCETVQVCTSVMEYGYRIIDHLKEGLSMYMQQKGYTRVEEIRGKALSNIVLPEQLNRNRRLLCEIDRQSCIGCGRCYLSCQDGGHQAITWEGYRPRIEAAKCVGCGLCTLVCPTDACTLNEVSGIG